MDVKNTDFEKMKHNLCFLVLEGAIMLPLLIMRFSWQHLLAYVVLGGYLVNMLIRKPEYKGNPAGLFSTAVFVDILLVICLHMDYVWEQKEVFKEELNGFLDNLMAAAVLLIVTGVVLNIFYKRIKIRNIFLWAILEACMAVYIYGRFGSLYDNTAKYVLLFYTAVSAAWIFAETLSRMCDKSAKTEIGKKTIFLFVLFFLLCVLGSRPFLAYLSGLPKNYLSFSSTYFSDIVILLLVAITGVLGYVLQPKSKKEQQEPGGRTTLLIWGIGGFCIVLKCSQVFYFTYVWALILAYCVACHIFIQKIQQKKYENYKLYGIEIPLTAVYLGIMMYLVNRGLWILALTALISTGLIFLVKQEETLKFRLLISWFLMAEGAVINMRGCIENLIVVLLIVLCGVICTIALDWPHPAGLNQGKRVKTIGINAAVILLLLIPCFSQGSSIEVEATQEGNVVSITVEAEGKENQVKQSYYYWRDGKGQRVSENTVFQGDIQGLSMENECLTIVSIDKNDIKTERKVWFPYGFYHIDTLK